MSDGWFGGNIPPLGGITNIYITETEESTEKLTQN